MFKDNKYTKWYFAIVKKALESNRPYAHNRYKLRKKGVVIDQYYEDHHVIPKSLGGSNCIKNKVVLTAREHFICHLLLTKMTESDAAKKMSYALWNLIIVNGNKKNKQDRNLKISSKLYEDTRAKCSSMRIGREFSKESRDKLSKSLKKVTHLTSHYGEDNPEFKGYYHTPWGKFVTAQEASDECPYRLPRKRISRACKESGTKIIRRKPIEIPIEWIDKTHREVGFWFEPVNKDK